MRYTRFRGGNRRKLTDADVHNIRYNAQFLCPPEWSLWRKAQEVIKQLQLPVKPETVLSVLQNASYVTRKGLSDAHLTKRG